MQFRHVTLMVKDLEDSIRFYQEMVGLQLVRRFTVGNGMEIVFLGSGGTEVELISGRTEDVVGAGVSLGFVSESLEDTMNIAREKGYRIDGGIVCPNPQTRFFFVLDPDGYRVQFINA